MHSHLHRCIDGASLLGSGSKRARQDEYPYHGHQPGAAGSAHQHLKTLAHRQAAHGEQRETTGNEKRHRDGHSVEIARQQTKHKVRQQEHKQRTKR